MGNKQSPNVLPARDQGWRPHRCDVRLVPQVQWEVQGPVPGSHRDSLYLLWRPAGGQLPTTGGGPGSTHLPHRDHPLLHHEGEAVCPLQQELLLGGERRGDNISWTRDSHTTILRLLGRVPSLLLSFHDMLALLWSPLLHGFQQPTFDIELVNHQNRQSDTEIIWCSQW